MKLFYAAAAVALAKQASAFRIVYANDGNYCLAQVKNDGSTDWTETAAGQGGIIDNNGAPATVLNNGDGSPTMAQNGINDPTGQIKTAADTAWAAFVTAWTASGPGATPAVLTNPIAGAGVATIYEAGAENVLPTLAGLPAPSGSLSWCQSYSTMAPDHYCKADGAFQPYQSHTIKADIPTCCADNHPSMENTCIEVSTGVPAMGDGTWYVDYTNNKCIRNCSPDNLFDPTSTNSLTEYTVTDAAYAYECAGLKTTQTSWTNIADCCSNRLMSLQPTYCAYRSELGSSPAPTPAYTGTGDWYADASNSLCVQDAPVTTGQPTYGGTVTAASTNLYTSAALCCQNALPWLDSVGCETRSTSGQGTPTGIYWASPNGCKQDCTVVTGSPNCAPAPTSAKLYQTANDCCTKANAWVNLDYCVSRANPAFDESVSTSTGSNLWFVDYEDGVCRKDCYPATGTIQNPVPCEWADSGSMTFYSSAAACCSGALGSNNQDACEDGSANNIYTITNVPTNQWYVVSGGDQPCAQDCATGAGNTACGGVIAKTGAKLYASADECCKQAYPWVDNDLCETLSLNVAGATYTGKWYVSYSDNACQQDCDPAGGPACHGTPDDISTTLFATPEACCAAKLGWIDDDVCKDASLTGAGPTATDSPGTGQWRKNDAWSYCVLDCKDSGNIETGDPILTVQPLVPAITPAPAPLQVGDPNPDQCDGVLSDSSATMYGNSVSNCCDSINWVQSDTCLSLSTGVVSEMFFSDPSDNTKCVVQQAASTTGSGAAVTCDANGEVDFPTADAGVTCVEDITVSTKLYSTLKGCCDANVPWDSDNCVHASQGTQYQGSGEYYVDWSISQCVTDCQKSTTAGSTCGGIANKWDTKYPSANACCDRLSWIPFSKCQYVVT